MEEDSSKAEFHLPTYLAQAKQIRYSDSFSRTDKISDKDVFSELDAISEEVISCRKRVLEKIS